MRFRVLFAFAVNFDDELFELFVELFVFLFDAREFFRRHKDEFLLADLIWIGFGHAFTFEMQASMRADVVMTVGSSASWVRNSQATGPIASAIQ